MRKYREMRIFVGHAFSPACGSYELVDFRKSIHELVNAVETSLLSKVEDLRINLALDMEVYSDQLSTQIETSLSQSNYGVFDISDNNPNVLFELGHLAARSIPLAIIKSRQSIDKYPVPVDISNRLVYFYDDIYEVQAALVDTVTSDLVKILRAQHPDETQIQRIWFRPDSKYLHIVCPPILEGLSGPTPFAKLSSPNYIYLDNFGDKDALLEILIFLARHYPKAKLLRYSSEDFPMRSIEDNLVVIGGPGEPDGEGNYICRQMMKRISSHIAYTDDCEHLLYQGESFSAEYDKGGYITRDYGYFARFPNPFHPGSTVVLVSGIHTFGALGASLAFSDHPTAQANMREVIQLLSNDAWDLTFETFFPVDVLGGEVLCPKVNADLVMPIV